jgi:hypothetical protein
MTIGGSSDAAPALAIGAGRVFAAWRGTDQGIQVASASTTAAAFEPASALPETTLGAPALAFVEGKLLLAWTGTDRRLNLAELHGGATAGKRTLEDTSARAPALAGARSMGGKAADLHLFWRGTNDETNLNVTSADDGGPFGYKLTFAAASLEPPSAAVQAGRIFVSWRGNDPDHRLHVARYNPGEVSVYGLLSP